MQRTTVKITLKKKGKEFEFNILWLLLLLFILFVVIFRVLHIF